MRLPLHSFALQRIATAALILGSNLFAAGVLGAVKFGELALVVFIAKMSVMGGLGSASGYIFEYFQSDRVANPDVTSSGRGYLVWYQIHLLLVALGVFLVGVPLGAPYVYGALAFLLLSPAFVVEPILRSREAFAASLVPDVILSLAVIVVALASQLDGSVETLGAYSHLLVLVLVVALSFPFTASWAALVARRMPQLTVRLGDYLRVISRGLPLYAGTAGFVAFQATDRLTLEQFHDPADFGTYMLAFQLASGGALLLTSMNFVAGVDFGKLVSSSGDLSTAVRRRLKAYGWVTGTSLMFILGTAICLQRFVLDGYSGLTLYSLLLGGGLLIFHWAGSVTPVAFHTRRQVPLTLAMWSIVALGVCHNIGVTMSGFDTMLIPAFSGLWLLCYGGFAVFHSLDVSKNPRSS